MSSGRGLGTGWLCVLSCGVARLCPGVGSTGTDGCCTQGRARAPAPHLPLWRHRTHHPPPVAAPAGGHLPQRRQLCSGDRQRDAGKLSSMNDRTVADDHKDQGGGGGLTLGAACSYSYHLPYRHLPRPRDEWVQDSGPGWRGYSVWW